MTEPPLPFDALSPLLAALCDGTLDDDGFAQFEALLATDAAARWSYIAYMDLHGELCWDHRGGEQKAESSQWSVMGQDAAVEGRVTSKDDSPLGTEHSTSPFFIDTSLPSPFPPPRYAFIDSPLFAFLLAGVIMGVGLAIAAVWKMPDRSQIARSQSGTNSLRDDDVEADVDEQPSSSAKTDQSSSEFPPMIGQITGMVNCKWSDVQTEASNGASVPLGRKYALSSGLMEITYDTGAKVILQGPCTYEVESEAGGYLSVGKLTAKVEKDSRSKVQGSKAENQKSEISSLSTLHSPLFSVRTPTATVTDLGTEFGVEVDEASATTHSRVFRGAIRVQVVDARGKADGEGRVLRENESVRVDSHENGPRLVAIPVTESVTFIRTIPKVTIKTFDLVDVVAGGDGFSGRRGRGIDPTSGRATDAPSEGYMTGDGQYHRVEGLPFVDGVFIPDGRSNQVQIDSAGHTFASFGNANNLTANHIWAGGPIPTTPPNAIPTEMGGIDFASPGHGLLFLHSNKGLTFDLDAIRRANPGCKVLRFRAVAGNTEIISATGVAVCADLWVLVDGQPRFKRRDISNYSGAMPVNIAIGDNDRFLTLAATDGGHAIEYHWTMFGDPQLDLVSVMSEKVQP